MARLFRKEYHEHSNTWYFKKQLLPVNYDAIKFRTNRDENDRFQFIFYADSRAGAFFPAQVKILYDPLTETILEHQCTVDRNDDNCRHYLTVIDYAYNHLGSEILDEGSVQVYRGSILKYNEFWQRVLLNSRILLADIYDPESDKIRFYFEGYERVDIRLISLITAG
jgi:hypothetical protein